MLGVLLNRVEKNEPLISTIFGLVVVAVTAGLIGRYLLTLRSATLPQAAPNQITSLEMPRSQPSGETSSTAISTYTVKAGDSLWSIAESVLGDGYQYQKLATLNQLSPSTLLEIGQVLNVPVPEAEEGNTTQTLENPVSTYTVKAGDSLWSIAESVLGDGYQWQEIWSQNQEIISNPNLLHTGTVLKLRGALYNN